MLGERGPQRGLFDADVLYGDFVGRSSFYGFLAAQRGTLFRDEDFAPLYCATTGRPSVPPSLLATALVLQTFARVSDEEAKQRADYDLRWKVALGIGVDERPFAKSTLQEFRAQLILHEQQRLLFQRSLDLAKRQGAFGKQKPIRLALDTTAILGRGAVKDTYNLLADGIVQVLRVLARQAGLGLTVWARQAGFDRYVAEQSVKGQAAIAWEDVTARRHFLQGIVADADRVLELVRQARQADPDGRADDQALVEAAGLLCRLLVQDIERRDAGPDLRQGVARDRVPSVPDPEQRHGRKSKAQRFTGHKAAVAVDTDSQLITAVAVLAGNAPDHDQALALVEQTEAATATVVEETLGDCAYGNGATRQAFAAAGRQLVAKVATVTNQGRFPKPAFTLDLVAQTCRCPAGQVSHALRRHRNGGGAFHFATAVCGACPLRAHCVRGRRGRTVQVHPQEGLLQEARALQASPAFRDYRQRRPTVEHRLARLVQLGLRQARYRGRTKTLFQLALAAAVANLTLLAGRVVAAGSAGASAPLAAALVLLLGASIWCNCSGWESFPLPPSVRYNRARAPRPVSSSPIPPCRPDF